MAKLSHDPPRLNGALRYRNAAGGTAHINAHSGVRKTRTDDRCKTVIHPRRDRNSCRQPKLRCGVWQQGSNARAREHFGR
jgi:hypothetical protein